MKTFTKGALLSVALMGLVACGGGDDGKKDTGKAGAAAPAAGESAGAGNSAGAAKTYNAADHKGSLKGTVKFGGTAPEKVTFNVSSDAFCVGKWEGKEPVDQQFEVNADGTLPHVFIYPKSGPHKDFEGYVPPTGFKVVQHDCFYVPHVFGVMEGQEFTVHNDDQTMHNVNVKPKRSTPVNKGQAPGDSDTFSFGKKEKAIPFACDVHSWMSAKCWVMDNPFYATTGADGSFEIKGLPDGKYTFVAWHETFGEVEFEVEIAGGEASSEVTLSGK